MLAAFDRRAEIAVPAQQVAEPEVSLGLTRRQRDGFGSAMKRPLKPARIFGSETRPPVQLVSRRSKTSDGNAGGDSMVALIVIFARRCKIHAQSSARESVACR